LRDGAKGDATPLSRDGGSTHGMEERAATRKETGDGARIPEFSFRTRSANLSQMRDATFDILVIGGGIVGAGVARDAASRGYRTALVDRGDFAGGTSGKTSRLIHGGLRYLRNYRLGQVRLAARERDLLVDRAPSLVHPLPFLIPAYRDRGPGPILLRFGLFLYDVLSRKRLPRRVWLPREDTWEREPGLRREGLAGAGVYYDAWTDDARLVLSVVRDAARMGAVVANHVEVVELIRDHDRIAGARVRDRIDGLSITVRARLVVNATGVWLDRLRGPRRTPTVRPTKGIHIFLPRAKVGNRHALALTTRQDRRLVFILPWNELTLVGTTDTDFPSDPDRVLPDSGEVDYLLAAVNDAFPDARVGRGDVVSAFAGLRPLIQSARGGAESDVSRRHAMFEDPDGLISVAGGKLTTHRAMAESVVTAASRRLGSRRASRTRDLPLGPALRPLEEFMALDLDEPVALHLQGRHTPQEIRRYLDGPLARDRIVPGHPSIWAQVDLAVHQEMGITLSDVLIRRLGLFYEAPDQALDAAEAVASRIGRLLGWDAERTRRQIEEYRALVASHQAFREGS
jgi:glycerol-3-phosphate dehydrogenase